MLFEMIEISPDSMVPILVGNQVETQSPTPFLATLISSIQTL